MSDTGRENHATRMFAWEEQVAKDPDGRRQATAQRVARLLRKRVDKNTGRASGEWVEQKRMAEELNVSRYGLQKALYWLRDRGHILIHCGKRWRVADEYEPILRAAVPTTVGRSDHTDSQPELAPEANGSWRGKPTAVGTDNHSSSSNFSARTPEFSHGKVAPDFKSSRDAWRLARSKLEASVAADQAGESDGGETVRPSATARRG